MPGKARSIDEYLAALPSERRAALQKLRRIIQAAAPEAEETVSYGIPSYRFHGMLVGFGAGARHCAFYLMSGATLKGFKTEMKGRDTSVGTIRFTPDRPLPAALVRKLVKARVAENLARR
jgi:uncharacterized protein YdhG (YjbR/CyaY superfamily)